MGEKYPIRRDSEQSADDMAEQMRRTSAGNKLNRSPTYSEVSAELKAETLGRIIEQQQASLAKLGDSGKINRVDLNSLDAVRQAADKYLQACRLAAVVPSISGLSAALGYSRQWICMVAEKQTEVGFYMSALFASISSCLEQMSLMRQTDAATSIFLMKNGSVGMTDHHTLTAIPADMNAEKELTKEELEQWFLADREHIDAGDNHDD